MRIDFYEEFPTIRNISKLKLIKFKTKLFVAAKSFDDFKKIKSYVHRYKHKNIELVYWPILKNSYYISGFSNTEDLNELFTSLNNINEELLIDLELPWLNPFLFIKNFFKLKKNRKIILNFLEKNSNRITLAVSYLSFGRMGGLFGLKYHVNCNRSFMWYSSTRFKWQNSEIIKKLKRIRNKNKQFPAIGTIAGGIYRIKFIESPEKLEKDLAFLYNEKFKEVIIFRLGGLNKKNVETIEKFVK